MLFCFINKNACKRQIGLLFPLWRVFSWWKPQPQIFFFCFNFSWRNSKLVCDSPSGSGNAGGFGWSFCLAGFPSVQKTSQRICALNGDTFEQEIHRRSLGCPCLTLEKRPAMKTLLLRRDPDNKLILTVLPLAKDLWHSSLCCDDDPKHRRCLAVASGLLFCVTDWSWSAWGYLYHQTKVELKMCAIS